MALLGRASFVNGQSIKVQAGHEPSLLVHDPIICDGVFDDDLS